MTDGLSMINEMNALSKRLDEGIQAMGRTGRAFARAERDYKIALMQESLKLREKDMAVTLIDKVVYGVVAEQRFERDSCEILWKTAQENVNAIKLQMRILDAQISREWSRNE